MTITITITFQKPFLSRIRDTRRFIRQTVPGMECTVLSWRRLPHWLGALYSSIYPLCRMDQYTLMTVTFITIASVYITWWVARRRQTALYLYGEFYAFLFLRDHSLYNAVSLAPLMVSNRERVVIISVQLVKGIKKLWKSQKRAAVR